MSQQSGSTSSEHLRTYGRVHIVGAGPVGLFLTALLQPMEGFSVRLYEKRPDYTRTRMVKLAPYLVADSVASYLVDPIDAQSVEAIFGVPELDESLAFRRSIPSDLTALLHEWALGFTPLNTIERSLSDLIEARKSNPVQRTQGVVSAQDVIAMLEPGDILIDCTGSRSLLRDHLVPDPGGMDEGANTFKIRLEYALVITFLYGQQYDCNEYCKYYKNIENAHYKFIPAVHRTCYDGNVSHVTGIVNITADEYEAMPPQFDGQWLRDKFPVVAQSMDGFIDKVKQETHGDILGDLEIVRIPLDLYRARNATSRRWRTLETLDHPFANSPVFLVGDSAIGSPYFQSISLGFECAMFLAGLIVQRNMPTLDETSDAQAIRAASLSDLFDSYELYMYKQWLRVYMRTRAIKHNKDLLESVDDTLALLERLHIY
jgi:hypothetical protein